MKYRFEGYHEIWLSHLSEGTVVRYVENGSGENVTISTVRKREYLLSNGKAVTRYGGCPAAQYAGYITPATKQERDHLMLANAVSRVSYQTVMSLTDEQLARIQAIYLENV